MAGYWKKIVYLDYLENGMKIKNAGFVRLEENEGQMRMEVRVKSIPEVFEGQYELKADVGGTAGRISLSRGSGGCCVVWKTGKGAAKDRRLVRAGGIYIRLPGRHLLQAVWQEPMELWVEAKEDGPETGTPADRTEEWVKPENRVQTPAEAADGRQEKQEEAANLLETDEKQEAEPGSSMPQAARPESAADIGLPGEAGEKEPVCYGDKWEQLIHMYPMIHPFGDEREYLSIAPKDFVVLRSEYQKLVHNSFLLHGYYNYRHLILGKIKEKGEECFYLGVPGNFYGREKMVAEMFGFEAFEGEKQPAKAGDFGYFMKRVEI